MLANHSKIGTQVLRSDRDASSGGCCSSRSSSSIRASHRCCSVSLFARRSREVITYAPTFAFNATRRNGIRMRALVDSLSSSIQSASHCSLHGCFIITASDCTRTASRLSWDSCTTLTSTMFGKKTLRPFLCQAPESLSLRLACRWFELVDMLHKLALSSLISFFSDLQLQAGAALSTVYIIVLLHVRDATSSLVNQHCSHC